MRILSGNAQPGGVANIQLRYFEPHLVRLHGVGPILIDCFRDPISEYHPEIQVKNDSRSRPTTGGDQPVHEIFRYVIDASGAHSATSGICEESRHLQMSSNNDPESPHPP